MEIIDVPTAPLAVSEWQWSESDWIVHIDGETAYRVNRKTGEHEDVDYEQAIREFFS